MPVVRRLSPAKINLGLEILGKREDGFHEIRSILARLTLADELTFTLLPSSNSRIEFDDPTGSIDQETNLVSRAIEIFSAGKPEQQRLFPDVHIVKHIPVAAGLGGASANAATTLSLLDEWSPSGSAEDLLSMAATLGSDVPFFLGSPAALVSGRGTELTPVPIPRGWVLLVSPDVQIESKTATLYRALIPADFTTGDRVSAQVQHLQSTGRIDPSLLGNTFLRPLMEIVPEIRSIITMMRDAGCGTVALSGAGPSLYSLFETQEEANTARTILSKLVPPATRLMIATFETGIGKTRA